MALITRKQEDRETIEVSDISKTAEAVTSQPKHAKPKRFPFKKRQIDPTMKIEWPHIPRALLDAVEFSVFSLIGGAACWAFAWVVSQGVTTISTLISGS